MFRPGSLKWVGLARWGFYVDLFFQIAQGDNAALPIGPVEWLRSWEEYPKLMSVLRIVQGRVRFHLAENLDKMEAEVRSKRRGRSNNIR